MGDGQPRLLHQVRDGIRQHTASRPSRGNVEGMRRFVVHYNKRHFRDMGAADVEAFPTHLAAAKRVSFFLVRDHVFLSDPERPARVGCGERREPHRSRYSPAARLGTFSPPQSSG